MGLFDEIEVKAALPSDPPPPSSRVFQTKGLESSMENYTITTDGLLVHHTHKLEVVPPSQRPFPDSTGFKSLMGSMRRIPTGDIIVDYHGDLEFYTRELNTFWAYTARFTEGKLVRIWNTEYTVGV